MIEPIKRNFGLKAVAVVIALVLWFTFNYLSAGEATYDKTIEVPVSLHGVGSGLIASTAVAHVTLELSGPRPKIEGLTADSFVAFVDCAGKTAGTYPLDITVVGSGADRIRQKTPSDANVVLDRYAYRIVPVVVTGTRGGPRMDAQPPRVTVAGAQSIVVTVVAVQAAPPVAGRPGEDIEVKPVAVNAALAIVPGVTIDPATVRIAVAAKASRAP